jgi:hypothetical protein
MTQINRLDRATWPIGWTPDNHEPWDALGQKLRKARALATELRALLEEAESDAKDLWENSQADSKEDRWLSALRASLNDKSSEAGQIEHWLDEAPSEGDKDPFAFSPCSWIGL